MLFAFFLMMDLLVVACLSLCSYFGVQYLPSRQNSVLSGCCLFLVCIHGPRGNCVLFVCCFYVCFTNCFFSSCCFCVRSWPSMKNSFLFG